MGAVPIVIGKKSGAAGWSAFDADGNAVSIFIDTKNYSSASNMFKDLGQIKAYFASINNFDEFYIIQQGGRGVTQTQIINKLRTKIQGELSTVFSSNQALFKNIKDINGNLFIDDLSDFTSFVSSDYFTTVFSNNIIITY